MGKWRGVLLASTFKSNYKPIREVFLMREKLIELLNKIADNLLETPTENFIEFLADYLIQNGILVTPCVAMVEQFIKDNKFDTKNNIHNGKYAVVYIDKSKWNCPLIDITEQYYNDEKALKRIEVLNSQL